MRLTERFRARGELEPGRSRVSLRLGAYNALGVVAATVIMVCANVLVARFYERWDVTRGRLYSLSEPSLETVHGLSEQVELIVLASQADPQMGAIKRLLSQYSAESRLLNVRYVDPDRDPAEFLAVQNRYGLLEGRSEDGRLVSDALMLVVLGDARWVITADDVVAYDDESGVVEPRLEQAITEGLRQVLWPKPIEVCFSQGHGEPALEDGGPMGLGALRHTLEKNNYQTRGVDVAKPSVELVLASCDLVIIAAPDAAFDAASAARLSALARKGKSFLLSVGPTLGEDSRSEPSGLEPLLALFGVRAMGQLIFERDPAAVVPLGLGGEVFLAEPKPHAVTEGLRSGGEARFRVLIQLSQALEGEGQAKPLLATSRRAFAVSDAAFMADSGAALDRVERAAEGPFNVAMAAELDVNGGGAPAAQSTGANRAVRLVMLGSGSPLLGHTWQDPTASGTRRFVESSVAWLSSRPRLVSLPPKPGQRAILQFTEQAMTEVTRYVLLYMPSTALALGVLILYRRRWKPALRAQEGSRAP